VTSDPDFKVAIFFDVQYLRNDTRYIHSYLVGCDVFSEFIEEHSLLRCDDLELSATGYTYNHDALGHMSWLDHMFVDKKVKDNVTDHKILDNPSNVSDHYAVMMQIPVDGNSMIDSRRYQKPVVTKEYGIKVAETYIMLIQVIYYRKLINHTQSMEWYPLSITLSNH